MREIPQKPPIPLNFFTLFSVFFVSIAIIAYQIVLMRSLSITRYSHFSYLVISTALLGFGTSGTFLTFFLERIKEHAFLYISIFFVFFTISMPLCYFVAQKLPLDIQYVLLSGRQLLFLLLYNLFIFIPFFLGGVLLGTVISLSKGKTTVVYGFNMLGSGAGGVIALLLMFLFSSLLLPMRAVFFGFCAFLFWVAGNRIEVRVRGTLTFLLILIAALAASAGWVLSPSFKIDAYKALSNLLLLKKEGKAEKVVTRYGPRARIDVFSSGALHNTLFAGLSAVRAPEQLAVLVDGELAGSIFLIDDPEKAEILDYTPQSIAYRLKDKPRVLLLGEVGGVNVWLARRFGASEITVVQTNPQLISIMQEDLAGRGGDVYLDERVDVINQDPRLFIERTERTFDIIQFVVAESMPSGSSGLHSLHEDYLLTVQAFRASLQRLSGDGFISITRGMQTPARDNIKIFGMVVEALKQTGVEDPAEHLLYSRNYIAVNVTASRTPISKNKIENFQNVCRELLMDIEHAPGIPLSVYEQQINRVPGPEGKRHSFYHEAAAAILSGEGERFYGSWVYDLRPATDDRPYFHNFFKWSSLGWFVETFGKLWYTRLELGYVVLAVTFLEVTIVAFVFILLPLLFLKKKRGEGGLFPVIFFACIGFGFMFLEMVFIQKYTKFMGDPIYSVAAALTSILVFSGCGSILQKYINQKPEHRIRIATVAILLIITIYLFFLDSLLRHFMDSGTAVRFILTVGFLFPLSFFMGWFFSSGVELLEEYAPHYIPLAWGVNGFSSVSASPLAVMLSMSFGFSRVIVAAAFLYLIAGTVTFTLSSSD